MVTRRPPWKGDREGWRIMPAAGSAVQNHHERSTSLFELRRAEWGGGRGLLGLRGAAAEGAGEGRDRRRGGQGVRLPGWARAALSVHLPGRGARRLLAVRGDLAGLGRGGAGA